MTYHFREAEGFTAMLAGFVPLKLELGETRDVHRSPQQPLLVAG